MPQDTGIPLPEQEYFISAAGAWNALAISGGSASDAVNAVGRDTKSIYFLSNIAGTLTIQIQEPDGDWQDFDTISISANTLASYMTDYDFNFFRIIFNTAATVTSWYHLK